MLAEPSERIFVKEVKESGVSKVVILEAGDFNILSVS